jgi:hypothetical protein
MPIVRAGMDPISVASAGFGARVVLLTLIRNYSIIDFSEQSVCEEAVSTQGVQRGCAPLHSFHPPQEWGLRGLKGSHECWHV